VNLPLSPHDFVGEDLSQRERKPAENRKLKTENHSTRNDTEPLRDKCEAALAPLGFILYKDELPASFVLRDPNDRRVDIHPVKFDEEGNAHQTALEGSVFTYPKDGFTGKGTINGREVVCLTPEVQILCHDGYELDAADIADMRLLSDHFGIPLPETFENR
jgi:hypothetical protein